MNKQGKQQDKNKKTRIIKRQKPKQNKKQDKQKQNKTLN